MTTVNYTLSKFLTDISFEFKGAAWVYVGAWRGGDDQWEGRWRQQWGEDDLIAVARQNTHVNPRLLSLPKLNHNRWLESRPWIVVVVGGIVRSW